MRDETQESREVALAEDQKNYNKERLRKCVLTYPPRWITIGITSSCNNRCVFCSYHSDDARTKSNVYNIPFSMGLNDFEKIVLMAHRDRVPRIHICGTGEPFLNKHVIEMIDCAASVYGSTSIQTNFFKKLFDRKNYLREIVNRDNSLRYITTDFLSGSPAQHNELKKGSSYEDVMNAIKFITLNSNIHIDIHFLLTKLNHHTLPRLVGDLAKNKVRNCSLNVVNLFAYDFNRLTSTKVVYLSRDGEITQSLAEAVARGRDCEITVTVPEPADTNTSNCDVFWQKIQIWPVHGNIKGRYHENLIPHACRAVVIGKLRSLGYIFDYYSIMDFWNSSQIVSIRDGILNGVYPDDECRYCYCFKNLCADDNLQPKKANPSTKPKKLLS